MLIIFTLFLSPFWSQDDLWQKDASEKRRKMLQQIKVLEKYVVDLPNFKLYLIVVIRTHVPNSVF